MDADRIIAGMTHDAPVETHFGNVTIEVRSIGQLRLPTGRVVVCEPEQRARLPEPLERPLSPGGYPVRISIAHFPNGDQRIALAVLQLKPAAPVRFEIATTAGQDVATLNNDEVFGHGVDSGTSSFMDVEAARALKERYDLDDAYWNHFWEEKKKSYVPTRDWANIVLDENTGLNVVAFSSGWGDGFYASYWGYDHRGELVCLITDFRLLDAPQPAFPPPHVPDWLFPGAKLLRGITSEAFVAHDYAVTAPFAEVWEFYAKRCGHEKRWSPNSCNDVASAGGQSCAYILNSLDQGGHAAGRCKVKASTLVRYSENEAITIFISRGSEEEKTYFTLIVRGEKARSFKEYLLAGTKVGQPEDRETRVQPLASTERQRGPLEVPLAEGTEYAQAEADWWKCTDPRVMFHLLPGRPTGRKVRLFACACCRRVWELLTPEAARNAVLVAERFADGLATWEELSAARDAAEKLVAMRDPKTGAWVIEGCGSEAVWGAVSAAATAAAESGKDVRGATDLVAQARTSLAIGPAVLVQGPPDFPDSIMRSLDPQFRATILRQLDEYQAQKEMVRRIKTSEWKEQADLLRHIFGNPFQPYPPPPQLPVTATRLAQALYEGGDYALALQQALQDAGSADLAEHFRDSAQQHPKGCWVLDLILGK
jgi:hypothetical protein